jgi:haloalkane dehalogenase
VATQVPTVEAVRTPDERFEGLPDFDFRPRYVEVDGLRVAYVEEGEGRPLLLLHGEPSWSFLFRKMIPPLRDAGFRCIAMDYLGFGRSDKPIDLDWYSYKRHTDVCFNLVEQLDLRDVVIVGHDWGGPIGLRMSVEHPERFTHHVLIDAPLFTGRQVMPPTWWEFHDLVERELDMPIGDVIKPGCRQPLADEVVAAYEAPFHDVPSKTGARSFPLQVIPLSPELEAGQACWRVMKAMRKDDRPRLVLWGEDDVMFPLIVGHWVAGILQCRPPRILEGSGHFVPEDQPEEAVGLIVDWLGSEPRA